MNNFFILIFNCHASIDMSLKSMIENSLFSKDAPVMSAWIFKRGLNTRKSQMLDFSDFVSDFILGPRKSNFDQTKFTEHIGSAFV